MKRAISQRMIKLLNTLLVTVALYLIICRDYYSYIHTKSGFPTVIVLCFLFWIIYIYCNRVYSGFLIMISRISDIVYSQMLSIMIADAIIYLLLLMITGTFLRLVPMFEVLLIQFSIVTMWATISHKWYFAHFSALKTLFLYGDFNYYESFMNEYGFKKKFNIVKALPLQDFHEETFSQDLQGVETVLISDIPSNVRDLVIYKCFQKNIGIYFLPSVSDVLMTNAKTIDVCHHPILRIYDYKTLEYQFFKRFFDIILASIACLLLSPIMLVTALAIKLQDGGPVFYRQKRLTKGGRVFEIYKFRSMREDAEKNGVARLSSGANDDRITPVGRIIRMVRIDELPQLLNIIKGDMSIVGPRPERPEIAAQYEEELPEFRLRLRAKAGLTGFAQVYGKYNTTPQEKLLMDLIYIATPSIHLDFQLMIATVKILFLPESTEGACNGQVNTTLKSNSNKEGYYGM